MSAHRLAHQTNGKGHARRREQTLTCRASISSMSPLRRADICSASASVRELALRGTAFSVCRASSCAGTDVARGIERGGDDMIRSSVGEPRRLHRSTKVRCVLMTAYEKNCIFVWGNRVPTKERHHPSIPLSREGPMFEVSGPSWAGSIHGSISIDRPRTRRTFHTAVRHTVTYPSTLAHPSQHCRAVLVMTPSGEGNRKPLVVDGALTAPGGVVSLAAAPLRAFFLALDSASAMSAASRSRLCSDAQSRRSPGATEAEARGAAAAVVVVVVVAAPWAARQASRCVVWEAAPPPRTMRAGGPPRR